MKKLVLTLAALALFMATAATSFADGNPIPTGNACTPQGCVGRPAV